MGGGEENTWAGGEESEVGPMAARGLCKQRYHGEVMCALGWACWKTYLGRPETDQLHGMAMNLLGLGLDDAKYYKYALSVRRAELSMMRRLGVPAEKSSALWQTLGAHMKISDSLRRV